MSEQARHDQHEHEHDHHHDHDHELDGCSIVHHEVTAFVREDILAKAKELAELISTSDEVSTYRQAERLVQDNEQVQAIISKIKKKQKEIVAFETTFKNPKMVEKIEGEMAELERELDRYPIVEQFKQTMNDINYLLQLLFDVIKDTVSEKITLESETVVQEAKYSD